MEFGLIHERPLGRCAAQVSSDSWSWWWKHAVRTAQKWKLLIKREGVQGGRPHPADGLHALQIARRRYHGTMITCMDYKRERSKT